MDSSPTLDPEILASLRELQSDDDPDFLKQLFKLFLDGTPGRIARIKAAHQAGQVQALWKEAHSIRSSAGNVGASRLSSLAGELDDRGKSLEKSGGAIDGRCAELVTAIEQEFERAKAEILGLPEMKSV